MKKPIPFKDLFAFYAESVDKIYNESHEARRAVIKHFGVWHYPYNDKFRNFQRRKRRLSTK